MIIMKKKELAEFLEVDQRTITRWAKKGCPRDGHSYNLKEVLKWRGVIGVTDVNKYRFRKFILTRAKIEI